MLAAGAVFGGYLLLSSDENGSSDASAVPDPADDADNADNGSEAADPAEGHDGTVREVHAGVWEGETTFMGGLPSGTITITLEPGSPGEVVGMLVHTPLIPISSCVDRLTLDRVTETEIVLDAEVVPEESTAGTCEEEPFQIFLGTGQEDVMEFSTDIREGAEGPLARVGQ
ncbi:hypothetical protein HCJ92_12850 [Streptomyces sp. ventii]|uniref:Uncharacterized protein n=1 Tax=Streptomyces spiramenti TaxID=2720606 RepID=A0ABX1ASG3_9ACTN|nr:hypothetical protein [Streptomyces spiramenti]